MTSNQMSRAELALMGRVVPCKNSEVNEMTDYILRAMGEEKLCGEDVLNTRINKYGKNHVWGIVTNVIMGQFMCITYILASSDKVKDPIKAHGGYCLCYVYNVNADFCSELGDCFFTKRSDGTYRRVS